MGGGLCRKGEIGPPTISRRHDGGWVDGDILPLMAHVTSRCLRGAALEDSVVKDAVGLVVGKVWFWIDAEIGRIGVLDVGIIIVGQTGHSCWSSDYPKQAVWQAGISTLCRSVQAKRSHPAVLSSAGRQDKNKGDDPKQRSNGYQYAMTLLMAGTLLTAVTDDATTERQKGAKGTG